MLCIFILYISHEMVEYRQDDLMSGMQDVAALADRYDSLSKSSRHLHSNIEKMKKEV